MNKTIIGKSLSNLVLTCTIGEENKGTLNDFVVLHVNHALPDVFALNSIIVDKLKSKLVFITTPYNQLHFKPKEYDYIFMKKARKYYKYYFNGKILSKNNTSDFVEALHLSMIYSLKHIHNKYPNKKLIVLQDGGYTAAKSKYSQTISDLLNNNANFLGLVEQTQGGTRILAKQNKLRKLNYPILTISRSLIKMRMENHFIAQRIIEETNKYLYKIGQFLSFKTIVVGGYGIIGRQVSFYLRSSNSEVVVLEKDRRIELLAQKEGFKTIDKISHNFVDKSFCYIGCTGQSSFGMEAFISFVESKSKEYYLVSGSSKRYEFEDIINFFETSNDSVVTDKYPILKLLKKISIKKNILGSIEYSFDYCSVRKTIVLIGEGFPINFYFPDSESVPDRAIDPIQTLLLTSLIKMAENKNIGSGILHVSDKAIAKKLNINEEELLKKWFYLNDIYSTTSNPFDIFKPHPLEKYLVKNY